MKKYKILIIFITVLVLCILSMITHNVISDTGDWKSFSIDFRNREDEISAYGSILGGVLAFLSILFVLYGLIEQRQQISEERNIKKDEESSDLLDRLSLLGSFLISTIDEIKEQGNRMKIFYEAEKAEPSKMHIMYFNTNKNFGRLVDMDSLSIYKSFQLYLKHNSQWEKTFLNTYNLIDFYSEALKELRVKYDNHINDKVREQKQIGYDFHRLLNLMTRLLDTYLVNTGSAEYLNFPWSNLVNDFIPMYYGYLQQCGEVGDVPDFRYLSDEILEPFLKNAMDIRRNYGYDVFSIKEVGEIIELASYARKKINEVEIYSLQYASDIEKQYNENFNNENCNLKLMLEIRVIIHEILVKHGRE